MAGINTNIASLTAQRNLFRSGASLQTSIERLSSGLRINSARDDAAGLAITERMTGQIRGMEVAKRNAGDGISALQVADGALASIADNLQRMRELAVQAQNGTYNNEDRKNLNFEYTALAEEVARVIGVNGYDPDGAGPIVAKDFSVNQGTKFNNVQLLNQAAGFELQIGANNDEEIMVTFDNLATDYTNGNRLDQTKIFDDSAAPTSATGIANAETAVTKLEAMIDKINEQRAKAGAGINRLEAVINNLETSILNLSAARSRILDADFARETANLTRTQILQQAGNAMLAQSNQLPAQVLQLLQQ